MIAWGNQTQCTCNATACDCWRNVKIVEREVIRYVEVPVETKLYIPIPREPRVKDWEQRFRKRRGGRSII